MDSRRGPNHEASAAPGPSTRIVAVARLGSASRAGEAVLASAGPAVGAAPVRTLRAAPSVSGPVAGSPTGGASGPRTASIGPADAGHAKSIAADAAIGIHRGFMVILPASAWPRNSDWDHAAFGRAIATTAAPFRFR